MSVEIFVFSIKFILLIDSVVKYFESKFKDKFGQLICLLIKVSGCIGYVYVFDFVDSV